MNCDRCNGRTWVIREDNFAERCSCIALRPIVDRLRGSGVPAEFLEAEPWEGALPDLQGFPSPKAPLLTFTGKPGRGKSRLAVEVLRSHLERGGKGWFWSCEELLSESKALIGSGESEPFLLRLVSYRGILVLDDAWSNQETEYNDSVQSRIIRRRASQLWPTIVTTNLTEREIQQTEPRVASRAEGSVLIELLGPDYRKIQAVRRLGGAA